MIMTLVIGLVTGIVARLLLPGHEPYGIIGTCLVGIGGGWLGGFAGSKLGIGGRVGSIVLSVAGAMALFLILRRL
jgi:uncharacterized membrane protein YeaQ/YmgE (transglycosylase-associated protein family)